MCGRIEFNNLLTGSSGALAAAVPTVVAVGAPVTAPAAVFTDKTGQTPAANPVTLDVNGNGSVWATPGDWDIVYPEGFAEVRRSITVREDPAFVDLLQVLAPSSGSTLAIDASLGSIVTVSPTTNITTCTIANLQPAQRFVLDFVSDGSHTFAYPTVCKFAGGAQGSASSTAGYRDRYEFAYDAPSGDLIEVTRSLGIH
jgi:hypothetical protein